MNILLYWKWILAGFLAFMIIEGSFGFWCYEKGQKSVYQDIAAAPVKRDTVIKHDTIPAPPPVIKWLKPAAIYETPPEVLEQIDSMDNDIIRLKATLAEKAKPFKTEMDSTRFFLSILTHPWTRTNEIDLRLKPVPISYPEITNTQQILKRDPWYYDVLKIGGGVLVGYGIASMVHK